MNTVVKLHATKFLNAELAHLSPRLLPRPAGITIGRALPDIVGGAAPRNEAELASGFIQGFIH